MVNCSIEDCDKPQYQRRSMCASHYMRQHRYGDPLHVPPQRHTDLSGERFGLLTAVEYLAKGARQPVSMWLCRCDCGASTTVRTGDLRRGGVTTCGARLHQLLDVVGYTTAHQRVQHEKGKASSHACVDCGGAAAQWSYDHDDPDQLTEGAYPYSLGVDHYVARCVPCHKRFDTALAA